MKFNLHTSRRYIYFEVFKSLVLHKQYGTKHVCYIDDYMYDNNKGKIINFKKIIMFNEISILEVVEYTFYAQAFKQQKIK